MRPLRERQAHEPLPVDVAPAGGKHDPAARRFPVQAEFRVDRNVPARGGGIAAELVISGAVDAERERKFPVLLERAEAVAVGKGLVAHLLELLRIVSGGGSLKRNSLCRFRRQRIAAPGETNAQSGLFGQEETAEGVGPGVLSLGQDADGVEIRWWKFFERKLFQYF